jgi:hypothetical protein
VSHSCRAYQVWGVGGNAGEPGASVSAVRLALGAGCGAAGDLGPLAPRRIQAPVEVEVARWTAPIPVELRELIRRMARENDTGKLLIQYVSPGNHSHQGWIWRMTNWFPSTDTIITSESQTASLHFGTPSPSHPLSASLCFLRI